MSFPVFTKMRDVKEENRGTINIGVEFVVAVRVGEMDENTREMIIISISNYVVVSLQDMVSKKNF